MKFYNPSRTHEYVLHADRKSKNPTRFEMRRLTRDEMFSYGEKSTVNLETAIKVAKIHQRVKATGAKLTAADRKVIEALEPRTYAEVRRAQDAYAFALGLGLTAIHGLLDERDKPLELKPAEFLKHAPAQIIVELGEHLLEISSLTEEERKN